jgi:methylglutaconyl-CoA hydratase
MGNKQLVDPSFEGSICKHFVFLLRNSDFQRSAVGFKAIYLHDEVQPRQARLASLGTLATPQIHADQRLSTLIRLCPTMNYTTLELRRPTRHVTQVWLNRPAARNAFNADMVAELTTVFQELSTESTLRAVVLAGHGPVFCAGADVAWMQQMASYSWEKNRTDAQSLAFMLWVIYSCPVPVVGRIHGPCYGGGVGLAAVCDVVVAAWSAHFCLSEAKLGLLPATISPYVIRAIGQQAARRYFVTAERFSAHQAHAMGLVHEVCGEHAHTSEADGPALDAQVASIVSAIVANGPMAVRACKALVKTIGTAPITARLRAETAARMATLRASAEGIEGTQSFLNKRKPSWLDENAK